MKRLALLSSLSLLGPLALSACSSSSHGSSTTGTSGGSGGTTGGIVYSTPGPPLPFGLGWIPDSPHTGPDGNGGGAFYLPASGLSGKQLGNFSGGSATPPPTADLTQWNPPIGQQGNLGSCASWSMGYSLASWWANNLGLVRTEYSPMFVYSQWTKSQTDLFAATDGGQGCNGADECGAFPEDLYSTVVQPNGVSPIVDYDPFMPSVYADAGAYTQDFGPDCSSNDDLDQPTPTVLQFAKTYNMTNFTYREVNQTNPDAGYFFCPGFAGTSDFVKQQIGNGVPLVVGIPIWPEFDGYTGGTAVSPPTQAEMDAELAYEVALPDAGEADAGAFLRGGHAIFCDKYDETGLYCQNQWGADHGNGGWWLLSWAFVDDCIVEEATAVLTFTATPSVPVIAAPTVDGGVDGGYDCTDLEVDVNVLLGPASINTVTLYANGTQVDQQPGYFGVIVDGGGTFDGGPDAGVVGDGGDGWADDFVFFLSLDGGYGDGGLELKAVSLDDAGLSGTYSVTISCFSTDVPDAGDAGSSCSSTGAECTGNGSCCSGAATCMSDGVNSTCCFPAGTAPDNSDPTDCCNGNGLGSNGKCL